MSRMKLKRVIARRQMDEVIAFDAQRRQPSNIVSANPSRRTLRYLYVLPKRGGEVRLALVAVALDRAFRPLAKVVAVMDTDSDRILFRDMGFHGMGGWIVYWSRMDAEVHYNSAYTFAEYGADQWSWEEYRRGCGLAFPHEPVVNPGALAGTNYRYCGYDPSVSTCGLYDFLRLYRADRRLELVAKANLWCLACPAGLAMLGADKRFFAYVRANMDALSTGRFGFSDVRRAYRSGVSLERAQDLNRIVPIARVAYVDSRVPRTPLAEWVLDAVRKGASDRGFDSGVYRIMHEYARYVDYAKKAGYDLADEKVLFPPHKGWAERLERLEREAAAAERRRHRRETYAMRRRRACAKENLRAVVEKIGGTVVSGYAVAVLVCQKELRAEGRVMWNCVGCGMYAQKIRDGESLIISMRVDGKPAADVELDLVRGVVRQCYAPRNAPPPETAREAAERLLKDVKRQIKWRKAA